MAPVVLGHSDESAHHPGLSPQLSATGRIMHAVGSSHDWPPSLDTSSPFHSQTLPLQPQPPLPGHARTGRRPCNSIRLLDSPQRSHPPQPSDAEAGRSGTHWCRQDRGRSDASLMPYSLKLPSNSSIELDEGLLQLPGSPSASMAPQNCSPFSSGSAFRTAGLSSASIGCPPARIPALSAFANASSSGARGGSRSGGSSTVRRVDSGTFLDEVEELRVSSARPSSGMGPAAGTARAGVTEGGTGTKAGQGGARLRLLQSGSSGSMRRAMSCQNVPNGTGSARNAGSDGDDDSLSETEVEFMAPPTSAQLASVRVHTSENACVQVSPPRQVAIRERSRSRNAWELDAHFLAAPTLAVRSSFEGHGSILGPGLRTGRSSATGASSCLGPGTGSGLGTGAGMGTGVGVGPYGPLSALNTGGRASMRSAAESDQQEEAATQHRLLSEWEVELQRAVLARALGELVQRPPPCSGLLRCRLRKVTSFFGTSCTFQMFLESAQQVPLLVARKRKKAPTTSFIICQDMEELKKDGESCLAKLKANADDCEYTLWGRSNNKHVRKGYASEELFIRFPKATSPSRAAAAVGYGADGGGSGNALTSSPNGRLSGVSSKPGLLGSRKSGGGAVTPCAGAAAAPVLAVLPAPECSKTTRPEQLGNVLELAESGDLPAFLDSKVVLLSSSAPELLPRSGSHASASSRDRDASAGPPFQPPLPVVPCAHNIQLSQWSLPRPERPRLGSPASLDGTSGGGGAMHAVGSGSRSRRVSSSMSCNSGLNAGVVLQLSKLTDESYCIGFGYPLNMLSAFAIVLARIKSPDS